MRDTCHSLENNQEEKKTEDIMYKQFRNPDLIERIRLNDWNNQLMKNHFVIEDNIPEINNICSINTITRLPPLLLT